MWMWATAVAVGSPWVEPPGTVRVGVQAAWLSSATQFAGGEARGFTGPRCPEPIGPGQRMPYSCVTGGRYRQGTLTAFSQIGAGAGFALDLQLPLVWGSFEDDVGQTQARGLGDLRAGLRWGRDADGWAWAATVHFKAPTGPGTFVDRDVPLGDGQWDVTPGLRLGRSLWPLGWVETWQSLTVRLPNPTTGVDPGDEWRPVAVLGLTPVRWAGGLLRGEAIVAAQDVDAFGIRSPGRALLQARMAGFLRPVPAAWIEAGVALPVAGRRWPAAPMPYLTLMWSVERPTAERLAGRSRRRLPHPTARVSRAPGTAGTRR